MPDYLRRREEKPPVAKSVPKPKSILKAPKADKAEASIGLDLSVKGEAQHAPVKAADEKPQVFTDQPASANANLVAFEQMLI